MITSIIYVGCLSHINLFSRYNILRSKFKLKMCTVTPNLLQQFSVRKHIITAIIFTFIFKSVHLQQCSKLAFNKKHFGHRLVGFNISTTTEDSIGTCVKKCFQLTHCLSTNFNTVSKECDLNNITTDDMTTAVVKSGMSVLSDLRAWPKAMVGSCGDKPCHGRDICLPAGNSFLCRDSDCPNAPSFRDTTSTGSVEYGGKIVYTCIHSYHRVFGPDYLHCGWMSTWTPNVAINCSVDPCTSVAPHHGAVTETAPAHGATTTYSCTSNRYHGYTLSGTATQTCTAGRLSDSAPTCKAECPYGWTRYYDSCYLFGGGSVMTFSKAVNYCEGLGADLVQSESTDENTFVKDNLQSGTQNYWVGLTDVEEGVWRWYKAGELATYGDWNPGQPNGLVNGQGDRADEDCAVYYDTHQWHDIYCEDKCLPICELRLSV